MRTWGVRGLRHGDWGDLRGMGLGSKGVVVLCKRASPRQPPAHHLGHEPLALPVTQPRGAEAAVQALFGGGWVNGGTARESRVAREGGRVGDVAQNAAGVNWLSRMRRLSP
jgi:hypothetical protein